MTKFSLFPKRMLLTKCRKATKSSKKSLKFPNDIFPLTKVSSGFMKKCYPCHVTVTHLRVYIDFNDMLLRKKSVNAYCVFNTKMWETGKSFEKGLDLKFLYYIRLNLYYIRLKLNIIFDLYILFLFYSIIVL